MSRISVFASLHGTPGEAVIVEGGLVVRVGPLEEIADGWPFDAPSHPPSEKKRESKFS